MISSCLNVKQKFLQKLSNVRKRVLLICNDASFLKYTPPYRQNRSYFVDPFAIIQLPHFYPKRLRHFKLRTQKLFQLGKKHESLRLLLRTTIHPSDVFGLFFRCFPEVLDVRCGFCGELICGWKTFEWVFFQSVVIDNSMPNRYFWCAKVLRAFDSLRLQRFKILISK